MSKQLALKDRLKKRRDELAKGAKGGYKFFIFKEGTHRMRPLPVGEEREFAVEAIYFYLSKELGGIVSPATFNEPCAIMEAYQKLKSSENDDDRELAKTIAPKKRFFVPHIKYLDEKGTKVDHDAGIKLAILTNGQYQDLIDLYLDTDEAGDFTNPKDGYDIKYGRTGSGQFDTEYTVRACKSTPLDKKYAKQVYDPETMLKALIPTYEETQEIVTKIIGSTLEDSPVEKPLKKKKKKIKDGKKIKSN